MNDPVPAKATGTYQRLAPPPPLRATFESFWTHRMNVTSVPPVIITPDATIDLQWIGGALRLAGPDRDPQIEIVPPGETVIGFTFRPAAAAAWLGISVAELVGKRVPLEELLGRRGRELARRVRPHEGLERLLASLQAAITQEDSPAKPDLEMRVAHELIGRGAPHGAPLVPWLMRALEMSERTLRRRFHESFGYGPKTLDRILRYQRFLALSSRSAQPTAVLASQAGYSDQAHLVRESRRLTGCTPREIDRFLSGSEERQPVSPLNDGEACPHWPFSSILEPVNSDRHRSDNGRRTR